MVDQERKGESENELPDHRGADHENDRVADHGPEIRIGEQPRVVVEPDKARIRGVDADQGEVREAGIEGP